MVLEIEEDGDQPDEEEVTLQQILDQNRQARAENEQIRYYQNQTTGLRLTRHPSLRRYRRMAFDFNQMDSTNSSDELLNHCGTFNIVCGHCFAIKYQKETEAFCCNNGSIDVDLPPQLPELLLDLFTGGHPKWKHFMNKISKYNFVFQMTSFGSSAIVSQANGVNNFKIQGQVYHRIGSLMPVPGTAPKFLQIYFMNPDLEMQTRTELYQDLDRDLLQQLRNLLHGENLLVRTFKNCLDLCVGRLSAAKIVIHADKVPVGAHARSFNAPTTREIAGLIVTEAEAKARDIVLSRQNGTLQRVNELNKSYDALQYPMLLPQGSSMFHLDIHKTNSRKNVTTAEFYRYLSFTRSCMSNHFMHGRALSQQYFVDQYAKIEAGRLNFLRFNQDKLRSTEYSTLRDAMVREDSNVSELGKRIILPASHHGSPRDKHQQSQDAMKFVQKFSKPDLFLTMTCNPAWPEIKDNILATDNRNDRQDLYARVFHLKIKFLIRLLVDFEIFGKVQAYVISVEWQKRGLPHCHTLVWLKVKLRAANYDELICTEIADPQKSPVLFELIKKHNIHGPCDVPHSTSPCLSNGLCTKGYPKSFRPETVQLDDGYPLYRRRSPSEGGHSFVIKLQGQDYTVDNKFVVPYNPLVMQIFKCHFNVEFCGSVKSIKYVCKYIHKSSDMAVFSAETGISDEIKKIPNRQIHMCKRSYLENLCLSCSS